LTTTWETSVRAEAARCADVEDHFEAIFGNSLLATSRFEEGQVWRITALTESEPDGDLLSKLRLALQVDEQVAAPVPVLDQDWVAKVQRDMPAIGAGRYWIFGSHVPLPPRDGRIPILVDAASAFGTGHHESTKGCLIALDRLSRRFAPEKILDVGTGTGILAVAAAKTWPARIVASDNDPKAIQVASHVVRQNGVAASVRCVLAEGVSGRSIVAAAPFDLIVANILAGPLAALAPAVRRHAAPGGRIVVSGILAVQTAQVVAAYRAAGFQLAETLRLGDWVTIVFRRP
jgi:ribosomal protein L11 methyltransferase